MRWDVLQGRFLVYPGGSSGGGGQSTTNVTQMYSPEEAARRAKVMAEAERAYANAPVVGGPAGASADTLAAQDRMRAFSTGAGQQIANQAGGALKFGLGDVLYPESNPALRATQEAAVRPITEAYTGPGGALQQVRDHFGQGPGAGSREAIALGLTNRSYLNTVGDVSSRIASEGYNRGLDTFSKSLATAPSVYGLGMQPAATQDLVGQQTEGYQEAQRQWQLNQPWMNLQNYANVVFGGASPGTQTTSQGPGMSNVQRGGMALSGAAMGAMVGGPVGGAIGAGAGLLLSYL